jgi:hypothetical protein
MSYRCPHLEIVVRSGFLRIKNHCLDRFYAANPDLCPEKEIVRYKNPQSRRLVIDGIDKERFVNLLDANAFLADLENLLLILCEIRGRFSLKNLLSPKDRSAWRKRLSEEVKPQKQIGDRTLEYQRSLC